MDLPELPPRLTAHSLPSYSYVPQLFPHPVRDPSGHSHETPASQSSEVDQASAQDWYHWGIDLFNHGYYWEAHEAWEVVWHACGRSGIEATYLKGLIKLTAAGVKARQGSERGVTRHAGRAAALFESLSAWKHHAALKSFRLDLDWMAARCRNIADNPASVCDTSSERVKRVMPVVLDLRRARK